jgi:hypothetical protein
VVEARRWSVSLSTPVPKMMSSPDGKEFAVRSVPSPKRLCQAQVIYRYNRTEPYAV